jgi:hypothetical protein
MTSFIRKHWGNLVFALASFFWTGCGSGEISTADDVNCDMDSIVPDYGIYYYCPTPNRDNYKEESSNSAVSSSSEEKHSR